MKDISATDFSAMDISARTFRHTYNNALQNFDNDDDMSHSINHYPQNSLRVRSEMAEVQSVAYFG